jgi:short-subunit dehydrogenase
MSSHIFLDKVVIITGASSGIGRALAYQLAEQGAWLSLAARDKDRLLSVAVECEKQGGKAIAIPTDVADENQCSALIRKTHEHYNRIDMLLNNAGISMSARFDEINNLALFDRIMRVNYLGSVFCTYYALPFLKQTKGRIVSVSSLTGKNGVPTRSGYAASKHAMAGFFDSLRIELSDSGVTVTTIYPGFVTSEVRERALDANGKPLGKSHLDENKIMPTEECARLIIKAAEKRRRELVMTLRGKIGLWMKLIAPILIDRVALKAIQSGRT